MDTDMDKYLEKAAVLIEALPYIQRFNRRIIVVKYGGSAMVDETLKKQVIQDVTLLKLVGFKRSEKKRPCHRCCQPWRFLPDGVDVPQRKRKPAV